VHVVPAANCWTTDHVPEPHCWKEFPPTQFQRPSGEHWEPGVVLPDDATGDALAAGAADAFEGEAAAGVGDEAAGVVAAAVVAAAVGLLAATVAKTPAEAAGAEDWAAGAVGLAVDPPEAAPHPA